MLNKKEEIKQKYLLNSSIDPLGRYVNAEKSSKSSHDSYEDYYYDCLSDAEFDPDDILSEDDYREIYQGIIGNIKQNANEWEIEKEGSLTIIKHNSGKKHYKEGFGKEEWNEIEKVVSFQQKNANMQKENNKNMINWKENGNPFLKKDIFSNFTEELTQEWINYGFDKKQTREWLESGLQPIDASFTQWIRDEFKKNSEWLLDNGDEQNLRKQFQEFLEKQKSLTRTKRQLSLSAETQGESKSVKLELVSEPKLMEIDEKHQNSSNIDQESAKNTKRKLSISSSNKLYRETKLFKPSEAKIIEIIEEDSKQNKSWKDINSDFTPNLQKEWEERGFNYEQTKEWIEVGLKLADADFCAWLRDIKKKNTEWVLNNGNDKELREEYRNYSENWLEREFANFFTIEKIKNSLTDHTEEEKNHFFSQINNNLDSAFELTILLRKIAQIQKENKLHIVWLDYLLDKKRKNTLAYRIVNGKDGLVNKMIDELVKKENDLLIKNAADNNKKNWKDIHPSFTEELQKEWEKRGFSHEECKKWINFGLKVTDFGYAWLKRKMLGKDSIEQILNSKNEKTKEMFWVINEWILSNINFEKLNDLNCKDSNELMERLIKESNETVRKMKNSSGKNKTQNTVAYRLENMENILEQFKCSLIENKTQNTVAYRLENMENSKIDRTIKLIEEFNNYSLQAKERKNKPIQDAQEYINKKHPTKEEKERVTDLDISNQNLGGRLDLSEFTNLEKLIGYHNELIDLNVSGCSSLTELNCHDNLLTDITLPKRFLGLEKIILSNNNFSTRNLAFLTPYSNLKEIYLGNRNIGKINRGIYNKFTGSLDYLSNMKYLKMLIIDNTDISEIDLTKLPVHLEWIDASSSCRPKSKVKSVADQLEISDDLFAEDKKTGIYVSSELKKYSLLKKTLSETEAPNFFLMRVWLENSEFRHFDQVREKSEWETVQKLVQEQINTGLTTNNDELATNFIKYLKEENYTPEKIRRSIIINEFNELLREYTDSWKDIDLRFDERTREEWESLGFSKEETKKWIGAKLKFHDAKIALALKQSGCTLEEFISKKGCLETFCSMLKQAILYEPPGHFLEHYKDSIFLEEEEGEIDSAREFTKHRWKAQKWLSDKYPKEIREKITMLDISSENLGGELDLSDFVNLKELDCSYNFLTSLDVSKNQELTSINCSYNKLSWLILPKITDIKKKTTSFMPSLRELKCDNNFLTDLPLESFSPAPLVIIQINDNNFLEQDLSCFKNLVSLNFLSIGNFNIERIKKGIYNRFYGSLESLKGLNFLNALDISNTNISEGLEHLPSSVRIISCLADDKILESQAKNILQELKKSDLFTPFYNSPCAYAKKQEREHVNAQEWLDEKYPLEKRSKVTEISAKNEWLEGKLIIESFDNLEKIKFFEYDSGWNWRFDNERLFRTHNEGLTNIKLISLPKLTEFNAFFLHHQITSLEIKNCPGISIIMVNNSKLTSLDVSNCTKLVSLDCSNSKLTSLDVSNCTKLVSLDCSNSKLTSLDVSNCTNLDYLKCSSNQLTNLDVGKNINLIKLVCFNNKLTSLNLSNFLLSLICHNNQLTELDLSKIKNGLICDNNKLTNLDVRRVDLNILQYEGKIIVNNIEGTILIGKLRLVEKMDRSSELVNKVVLIQKTPQLGIEDVKSEKNKLKENYEIKSISYDKVYPESNFEWKINREKTLSTEELPLRLYNIKTGRVEKTQGHTNIKNYAILSYVWGDIYDESLLVEHDKSLLVKIKKNSSHQINEKMNITKWVEKALTKAIKTCQLLNINIDYLWMDQLCIEQFDNEEVNQEVPKMRQYYSNSTMTLIAINADINEKYEAVNTKDRKNYDLLYILEKIIGSEWFSRSWTFQEGWLSRQTIFMFDDYLIDGRIMAEVWAIKQPVQSQIVGYKNISDLFQGTKKVATPLGWMYYEKGYSSDDRISLSLTQALGEIRTRGRSVPIDGIYSVLGLLPYGNKVKVEYKKWGEKYTKEELVNALFNVMKLAVSEGYAEPLAWQGKGNFWLPEIYEDGSTSIIEGINIRCKPTNITFGSNYNIDINFDHSIRYVVELEDNYNYGSFGSDGDGLFIQKIIKKRNIFWQEINNGFARQDVKLIPWESREKNFKHTMFFGTYEVLNSIKENDILIELNEEEWKNERREDIFVIMWKEGNNYYRRGLVEGIILKLNWQKWCDEIDSSFTEKLVQQWTLQTFSYKETQEWINIGGLKPTDANFAAWLRDIKKVDAELMLSQDNYQELNQEFQWWQEQQQSQIQIPPKN